MEDVFFLNFYCNVNIKLIFYIYLIVNIKLIHDNNETHLYFIHESKTITIAEKIYKYVMFSFIKSFVK